MPSQKVCTERISSGVSTTVTPSESRTPSRTLPEVAIAPEDLERLQVNLVRSHACGVGSPLPAPVVRAAVLLRANTLATKAFDAFMKLTKGIVS